MGCWYINKAKFWCWHSEIKGSILTLARVCWKVHLQIRPFEARIICQHQRFASLTYKQTAAHWIISPSSEWINSICTDDEDGTVVTVTCDNDITVYNLNRQAVICRWKCPKLKDFRSQVTVISSRFFITHALQNAVIVYTERQVRGISLCHYRVIDNSLIIGY